MTHLSQFYVPGPDLSKEQVAPARQHLKDALNHLDAIGLGDIAAHTCYALDRLNEQYPAS